MDPFTITLIIMGVVSAAASALSAWSMQKDSQSWSSQENELQRQFTAEEAEKSRDFEQYMSNTAMQRSVADFKAAGINVGAIGGSNATSGATATGLSAPLLGAASGVGNILGHPTHGVENYLNNMMQTTAKQTLQQNAQEFAYNMKNNLLASRAKDGSYLANFGNDDRYHDTMLWDPEWEEGVVVPNY